MNTTRAFLAAVLLSLPQILLGQGSLTPPGAPAQTMKSLDQIEPRTLISALPFTISTGGSYYLTKSLSVASGNGITITVDNVVLDLNGFTISSTASPAAGDAILLSGGRKNVRITNGNITGSVTFNGSTFSGAGFQSGIVGSVADPIATTVSFINISGLSGTGIYLGLGTAATLIESCNVFTVGVNGLNAVSVSNSTAAQCGAAAITGHNVINCRGDCVANDVGINATVATNCYGKSTNNIGVVAGTATGCYGANLLGVSSTTSIGLSAQCATGCQGASNSGTGLNANTAENCYGSSGASNGIVALSAINCVGTSGGTQGPSFSCGIYATIAQNCYGTNTGAAPGSGNGVQAGDAMNCTGDVAHVTGFGVFCNGTAFSCDGRSAIGAGTTYFCRPTSSYP